MELYEKLAAAKSAGLLGTAARGAWNVGKGVIAPFSGTSATSSLGQKALHGMASAYTVGQPMAASLAPAASPPATANIAGRSFGNGQRDNGTVHTAQWKVAAVKAAFGLQNPKDLLDMGSYAAMIGSKLLPHDNPWHTRLEAAGLLGLGGSVGADMIADPHERKPGAKDLVGLGLFGSALYDRWKQHQGAGHGPAPA